MVDTPGGEERTQDLAQRLGIEKGMVVQEVGDGGCIWLLTPGAQKPGTVEPGVISESAQLAGMVQTKADRFGDWQASCLVGRGYTKSKGASV